MIQGLTGEVVQRAKVEEGGGVGGERHDEAEAGMVADEGTRRRRRRKIRWYRESTRGSREDHERRLGGVKKG